MAKVKMLEREIYELIAAGEVIDRPSSIIKELAENSIDSGASVITVEIKHGGISYMRVTDNGCGIFPEDLPTAFMRHATSKISSAEDLDKILTLGFRGEALASVAAVSKTDVLTKVKDSMFGAHYVIEGTEEKLCEECGCPDGTTVVVRDIFYNVPARLKFLKKDVSEGNDIARVMEKIALSRPDISVRFIRDNKQAMFTPGDGQLYSVIYSIFGRQFAASVIPANYSMNGIKVTGYTVKPLFGMKNRRMQNFFVNGRYVQSYVCVKALEEAYKNCIMEGKFPACVLCIEISPEFIDVNVHPKKTDVRFSDERVIYDTVYFAVKNAILSDSAPEEIVIPKPKPDYSISPFADRNSYEQTYIPQTENNAPHIAETEDKSVGITENHRDLTVSDNTYVKEDGKISEINKTIPETPAAAEEISEAPHEERETKEFRYITDEAFEKKTEPEIQRREPPAEIRFKLVGEAFGTYIIAETDSGLIFIDKHAAHERINFEKLKSGELKTVCQMLLKSEDVRLSYSQYDAVCGGRDIINGLGFDIEPLEAPFVRVNGIPSILDVCSAAEMTEELARNLDENKRSPMPDILDDMLHSIACKASVRANDKNSPAELEALVKRVFTDENIRYCPHGRPVMFNLSRRELEKQFRRIT